VKVDATSSKDEVRIAYTASGSGDPALVFIHGGLADRSFWASQMEFFAARHRVIALDLAGHGESAQNRTAWSMQAFGSDVCAVIQAQDLGRAILIGNSLGGPVAVEAALLAPDRIIGIVAVDTFHALDLRVDPSEARKQAEDFKTDFAGSLKRMVQMLFHPDADPAVVGDAERRMASTSSDTAWSMFRGLEAYDLGASVRRLKVPIRCINGDLFPVKMEENRLIYPDFDAIILPHTGHYPMLECPETFNRHLSQIVEALGAKARSTCCTGP
jgi:pimeloyl-ACP methyl ester carboxylesterase